MKKSIGLFVTLSFYCLVKAQSTFNSGGNTLKDSSISYAYSIGEVSGFSVKPYCMYTQGVIQPARFLCVPVKYEYNDLYEIALYPNPTTGIITIETDYPDFAVYRIFASDGRLVKSAKYTYSPISLITLPRGLYLFQLLSSGYQVIKTFKIIKN